MLRLAEFQLPVLVCFVVLSQRRRSPYASASHNHVGGGTGVCFWRGGVAKGSQSPSMTWFFTKLRNSWDISIIDMEDVYATTGRV